MKTGKWVTLMDDTDYNECRLIAPRVYQVIEVTDMVEACGRDWDGKKFNASLDVVDLNTIPAEEVLSALRSCGYDNEETMKEMNAEWLVECLHGYGCKAPLEQFDSNGREVAKRMARKAAHELLDAGKLEEKMDQPVNKLGSTAREFIEGNIFAGIQRGVEAGKPESRLMAKMYGVDQYMIDDVRPDDFMPYFMGYMDALGGRTALVDTVEDKISPEYFRGYERGERVKKGECPAPGWIKTQKG